MNVEETRALTRSILAPLFLEVTDTKDAIRTSWALVNNAGGQQVNIVTDNASRWRWSERLGLKWPDSRLNTLDGTLTILLDKDGNLVDLFMDEDQDVPVEIPGNEIDAFIEDALMLAVSEVTGEPILD